MATSSDCDLHLPCPHAGRQAADDEQQPKERSIFRRRKAKGPNPLSARPSAKKKAKQKPEKRPAAAADAANGSAQAGKQKPRARRKRAKQGSEDGDV